jgi:hypothetical protein
MAAPSAWIVHDLVKEKLANAEIDFGANAHVVRLYSSSSDIDTVEDNDASAATGELTTANGYTAGGAATTPSVTQAAGTTTVDFTDVSWSATAAGITARFAAIVNTALTPDEIIAHCVLDSAPADVTAPSGNAFNINFHSQGGFQLI